MKYSVIIPVYNSEKYLDKCLDSILNQGYEDFEIIVVNDGSTDSSDSIIKNYLEKDSRIKYFCKENEGVSAARNFGMKMASGEYILFVDSDDELFECCLEHINAYIDNGYDIVVYPFEIIDENSYSVDYIYYLNRQNDIFINSSEEKAKVLYTILLSNKSFAFCWNFAVKKDIIDGIRFNENVKLCEDLLFDLEMYTNIETAVLLNKPLYKYRKVLGSASNTFDFTKLDNIVLVYEKKIEYSEKWCMPIDKNELNKWLCREILRFYKKVILNKKISEQFCNYVNKSDIICEAFDDCLRQSNRLNFLMIRGNFVQRTIIRWLFFIKQKGFIK